MKHTPIELTAILEELILDNGTTAVLTNMMSALRNRRDKSFSEWENGTTARDVAKEWDRQARIVADAVRAL